MDSKELYGILENTIKKGLVHKYYDRTLDIAKFNHQILTGQDQDDLIVQYKIKESDSLKEQRVRLTNSYTPYVANQIMSVYRKVKRTDGIKRILEHEDSNTIAKIENKLGRFYGSQSYERYLHERLLYFYFYDPNAFLIFERENKTDQQGIIKDVNFYPFEVPSNQAINYCYKNGNLEWLIVKQKNEDKEIVGDNTIVNHTEPPQHEKNASSEELFTYYIYSNNLVVKLEQYDPKKEDSEREKIKIKPETGKELSFYYQEFKPGSSIQAIKVGNLPDPESDKTIFVSPLYPAKEVFEDIIRDKSYLDLTKSEHTFLQKYVYAESCEYEHEELGECVNGHLGESSQVCPKCNGKGKLWHTTEQEVVAITLPDGEGDPVPLERFAHYVTLPHETPRFQAEELEKALKRAIIAVFNTEIFETPQLAATATAAIIEHEKIYDVLSFYADQYSLIWEFGVNILSEYLQKNEDLTALYSFPVDFKMRSLAELLQLKKMAKESGLSHKSMQAIEHDILSKQYADNPTAIADYKSYECFKPFQDKSVEEIALITMSRSESDYHRIVYENFDMIIKEIEVELRNQGTYFHVLNYEKQKEIFQNKVDQYRDSIQYRNTSIVNSFEN